MRPSTIPPTQRPSLLRSRGQLPSQWPYLDWMKVVPTLQFDQEAVISTPCLALVRHHAFNGSTSVLDPRQPTNKRFVLAVGIGLCLLFGVSGYLLAISMNRYQSAPGDQPIVTLIDDRGPFDSPDMSKQLDQHLAANQTAAALQLIEVLTEKTRLTEALDERLTKLEYERNSLPLRRSLQDGRGESTLVKREITEVEKQPQGSNESSTPSEFIYNSSIPLVTGALTHLTTLGQADYWLIKRAGSSGVTRAIPIGKSQLGVLVHSLDDGHNYVVTESGGWMGSDTTP